MKPLVNLASNPFRNRRLFWMAILLLFAIPAYVGLEAIGTKARVEAEIFYYQGRVADLQRKLGKTEKPAAANTAISGDKNQQLLAANELVARRAFSWSQLLNDVERNLPPTVRVLRIGVSQIRPEERTGVVGGEETAATLGMTVIGKSGTDVTAMINKFHDSGRFKVAPLSKKAIEGIEDVEFELKVEYYPPNPPARSIAANQIAIAEKKQP
ncbi:MAG: hypothetical protein ACKVX9_08770 [Blastocatellia bacterium]